MDTHDSNEQQSNEPKNTKLDMKKFRQFMTNKWVIIVAIAVIVLGSGGIALLLTKPTDKLLSKPGVVSLDDTGYTGVSADVLTNQTFDCQPRNENEWYRTDHTLAVDPTDPNVIYVNVEWKGVFKSIDGGKNWQQITKGIKVYARSDDETKGCYSEYPTLRIDPSDNQHLVLSTSGGGGGFLDATTPNSQTGGVYQSFDGGENWKLMITNKMNIYSTDVAIDKNNLGAVYYGTASNPASWQGADQTKLYVTDGLMYQTKDNGGNWLELPTGIGKNSSVTRIMINPNDSNNIVASTYSAVRQSDDGTGTGVSDGKNTSIDQMGVLRTIDGGKTWSSTQLPTKEPISYAFVSPTNFNNMFFVSESQGSSERPAGYISLDAGKTFLETAYMNIVAYDPFDATGMHVIGYSTIAGTPTIPNLNLFESRDGGKTWKGFGTLPSEIKDLNYIKTRPSNIIWHPTDKNTIYMSGSGAYIWKSSDFGKTWTTLLDISKLS